MNYRLISTLFVLVAFYASWVHAGGTVQLELVGDRTVSMAFQEWGRALDKAGISNVQIRSGGDSELQPGIVTVGTPDLPVYQVTGIVLSREEIALPGGRFKRTELGRLKQWLDDLGQNGLPSQRPAKVAFGLTQPQFESVKKSLGKPIGYSTVGLARREVIEKILKTVPLTVEFSAGSRNDLGEEKIEDELTELTSGTALAFLLRSAGYGFVPKVDGGRVTLSVVKFQPEIKEVWPVGRSPEKSPQEILPALMEFLPVNVQNVSAATAAEAIGKRLKTPVLYDRLALARHKIDPTQSMVTLPPSRTTYSLALKKILFQARLNFVVRVDEADTPFLWIETVKSL